MKLKNNEGQYLYAFALTLNPLPYLATFADPGSAPDWSPEVADSIICLLSDLGYVFTGEDDE